jgi:mono/diheme cytochrome c family protein
MRRVIISVLTPLIVIAAVMGGFLLYIRGSGFSARAEPTWMERVMARNARKIATPADAKSLTHPRVPQTEEMIVEADEHFVEHCGMCHGSDGRGNTTIGRNLYPKVPDMTRPETQQLSDGELYYIIFNGIRLTGMPAWGSEDKPEAIWDLVSLIRRLPKLTPEESKRLEMLANPPAEEPKDETTNKGEKKNDVRVKRKPIRRHTHTHKP